MTHGYGGRLGEELISKRGLIYYISNQYHSDGNASWISIRFGVNPDKLLETKAEFEGLMQQLQSNPPTQAELEEAKEHLIGRRISAYQSNEELTGFYVREWIEQNRILSQAEFDKRVHAVTLDQIHRIIPRFLNGAYVVVDTNP
jgi:predicted Zn-dependent peptidase